MTLGSNPGQNDVDVLREYYSNNPGAADFAQGYRDVYREVQPKLGTSQDSWWARLRIFLIPRS